MKILKKTIAALVCVLMLLSVYEIPAFAENVKHQMVIVLDPGHGSYDAGAIGSYNGQVYKEKDFNLAIAKACKKQLEKYHGVKVFMTRTDDTTCPDLASRANYAKSKNGDVLISFHNNSAASAVPMGVEVLVPNNNYLPAVGKEGQGLGTAICKKISSFGLSNRGNLLRNSDPDFSGYRYPDGSVSDFYGIVRNAKLNGLVGIIIEHGFMSNAYDMSILTRPGMLEQLGIADAKAIASYYGLSTNANVFGKRDYTPVYNYDYYVAKHPDIAAKFNNNSEKILQYFISNEMKNGVAGNNSFNVAYYRKNYADLRKKFGTDLQSYYLHYIDYGLAEKRNGKTLKKGAGKISDHETIYKGIDYSDVYDYDYYCKKYPNIAKKYANDEDKILKYFVTKGMALGQQACESFDVNSYKNKYQALRIKYGSDLKSYYIDYINTGKAEGKVATGVKSLKNPLTKYKGINYKSVYNYKYYIKKYPKLAKKYNYDDVALLKYFVTKGMKKGQQASADFDVISYYNKYKDLRKVYGKDYPKYYIHYIKTGKNEGRIATGVTTVKNYTTKYKGVNYKAVYDYNYYIKKHPKIAEKYNYDEDAILKYFVTKGMKKGQQASSKFNPKYYQSNNPDVAYTYQDDWSGYYTHYISNGKEEGRIANKKLNLPDTTFLSPIMGGSNVTADQMAAFYNDRAVYPEFYKTSDAPTIKKFCQIYIDECKAEGVNPEIAFCQAMKETGYLKFGGQVSITQFNFAGLGATDDGANGGTFTSVRQGVRAQVQHLKAYASFETLKKPCVDGRFTLVTRGTAPYVEWLGIHENPYGKGWASGLNYGYSVMSDYVAKLKNYIK